MYRYLLTTICCALLIAPALRAQRPGEGTPAFCSRNADLIGQACNELLPEDHRVWLATDEDGPDGCWCTCTTLTTLTVLQADSLRADRLAQWQQRLGRLAAKRGRVALMAPPHRRSRTPLSDSTTVRPRAAADTAMARLRSARPAGARTYKLAGRWITLDQLIDRVYEQFPIFNITYDAYEGSAYTRVSNDVNLDAAHTWQASDGPLPPDQRITIDIPSALLDDPAVDGELILFLLLHEVGHALGHVTSCMENWPIVCEGQADAWAAFVGLRKVFPGRRFMEVSIAAQRQLRAYDTAIEGDYITCGWCIACDDNNCGYPPLDCRLRTIRAGRMLRPVPACVGDWFNGQSADCRYPDDGCH